MNVISKIYSSMVTNFYKNKILQGGTLKHVILGEKPTVDTILSFILCPTVRTSLPRKVGELAEGRSVAGVSDRWHMTHKM